jgi:hypothetical protein
MAEPGRIVRAVIRAPYQPGQAPVIRPAIVVAVNDPNLGLCNLQIFTDGGNDRALTAGESIVWGVGYKFDAEGTREPGSWHWPARKEEKRDPTS